MEPRCLPARLNFGVGASYLALREFARGLVAMVAQEPRVDWDDWAFSPWSLSNCRSVAKPPFMAIWEVYAAVISTIAALEHEPLGLAVGPSAQNVAWRLRRIATQRMTEISGDLLIDGDPRETVELQIVLARPPLAELDGIGFRPSSRRLLVRGNPTSGWCALGRVGTSFGRSALRTGRPQRHLGADRYELGARRKDLETGQLARAALKKKKQPVEAKLPSAEPAIDRPPAGG